MTSQLLARCRLLTCSNIVIVRASLQEADADAIGLKMAAHLDSVRAKLRPANYFSIYSCGLHSQQAVLKRSVGIYAIRNVLGSAHSFASMMQEGSYYMRMMFAIESLCESRVEVIELKRGQKPPAKHPVVWKIW